jgi:hypothetical protein
MSNEELTVLVEEVSNVPALLQSYQESSKVRDYEGTSARMATMTEITDDVLQFIKDTPIESIRKLVGTEIISTLFLIWDEYNDEDHRCYACFFLVDILMNTIVQHLMDGDFKEEWMKDTTDMINKRRHHQDLTQNHLFRFSQLTAGTKTLDAYVLCGDEERNHYKNLSPFTVRIKSITGNNLSGFDLNGSSDPYVKIGHEDNTLFKSKTIKHTLNPHWTYEMNDKKAEIQVQPKKTYWITVTDWDLIGKDELMCKFLIDFSALKSKVICTGNSNVITLTLDNPDFVKHKEWKTVTEHKSYNSRYVKASSTKTVTKRVETNVQGMDTFGSLTFEFIFQ